ncbi:unnamed protein product [Rotaria sp. Silwood2]|nr:unnamed protein product [Rotaria sp. Silwood2]CAF3273486.1 unnamed protein product [Rotaria sp. Silwood2]CAF3503148.1 unnamed protein product [Rotaria sp. Silwood2]CAF4087102.1 unnamed protein product [Rotaria sp. Silwood2]CAF4130937.1 unnamed protein product [Rotaria sp. Silwood2]
MLCLVVPNLSSFTRWAQNATTVAGLANGSVGSSLSSLNLDRGINIANDNTLYIADVLNNRVVAIGPNSTTAIAIIQNAPDSTSLFAYPIDVFVTQKYLYVSDMDNFRLVRLFKNGTDPVTFAGIQGIYGISLNTSTISYCFNLFVDSNENLYASDLDHHRVVRYPSNSSSGMPGVVIAGNGTSGTSASQLNGPYGIFVNEEGTLYVSDSSNHRIQRWNIGASSGMTAAGTGVHGNRLSQLSYPTGIVVDSNGYMYIVDYGNNRIIRWAPNSSSGICIAACTGTYGNDVDMLSTPFALAFDSYGSLFISDGSNNRVQKFQILSSFGE